MPKRYSRSEARLVTRDRLIDAATKEFAERGVREASLHGIAERAGYSTGAIYSNFKGKDDLFLAVMERELERRGPPAQLRAIAGAVDRDAWLTQASEDFERRTETEREWILLVRDFFLYAAKNDDFRGELAERWTRVRRLLAAGLIARGVTQPDASPAPETVATIILALYQGLTDQRLIDPQAVDAGTLEAGLRLIQLGLDATAGK